VIVGDERHFLFNRWPGGENREGKGARGKKAREGEEVSEGKKAREGEDVERG